MVKNIQNSIEIRLQNPLQTYLKKDDTFQQVFGDLDEWVFQEGIFRFLLNPINRRWLFWDEFHNDWEDTGYYAGEVEFVWDGEKLVSKKVNNPKISPNFEPITEMISVNDSSQKYPIFPNTLIGNERNCDIKIENSDTKALILQHTGGHTFFGIGDRDAILVSHKLVPPEGILLHEGDHVTLGKTEFYFMNIPQHKEAKNTGIDEVVIETKQKQKKIKQKDTTRLQCSNCHAELKEGQKFCTVCGTKVDNEVTKKFCPKCGVEIKKGQNFCTVCGEKL